MESVCVVDLVGPTEPLLESILLIVVKVNSMQFQNREESFFFDKASFLCSKHTTLRELKLSTLTQVYVLHQGSQLGLGLVGSQFHFDLRCLATVKRVVRLEGRGQLTVLCAIEEALLTTDVDDFMIVAVCYEIV